MGGENVEIKEDKVACFTAWYKTIVLYLPLSPHIFPLSPFRHTISAFAVSVETHDICVEICRKCQPCDIRYQQEC